MVLINNFMGLLNLKKLPILSIQNILNINYLFFLNFNPLFNFFFLDNIRLVNFFFFSKILVSRSVFFKSNRMVPNSLSLIKHSLRKVLYTQKRGRHRSQK